MTSLAGIAGRRLVLALVAAVVSVGLVAGAVASGAGRPAPETEITITVRYSHFEPTQVTVPLGVPVTFRLINDDPIDHEWIVGDETVQAHHRTSTEPVHPDVPTEVMLPALTTRVTTITFERDGALQYICHLPGHEAYGMVGTITILRP